VFLPNRRYMAGVVVTSVALGLWPVAARALVVSETDAKRDYFTGATCGSTSTLTQHLPLGASHIESQAPVRGEGFRDEETGALVARLTDVSVQRRADGRPVVRYTATGSDDACSNPAAYGEFGWETRYVWLRATYTRRVKVYGASCWSARYRPRSAVLTCADANWRLRGMSWRRWNGRVASGRGWSYENDCVPYCAAGHFHSYPVVVHASKPRRQNCEGRVRYVYQRLRITYSGRRPPHGRRTVSWRWGCLGSDV
jgi:hypothetical protein